VLTLPTVPTRHSATAEASSSHSGWCPLLGRRFNDTVLIPGSPSRPVPYVATPPEHNDAPSGG